MFYPTCRNLSFEFAATYRRMRRLFAFCEINRSSRMRKSHDYARFYNDFAEVAANRRRSIGPIMRTTLTSFSFISRCVRIIRREWVESRGRNRGRLATPRELERRNCAAVVEPERRPLGNYHNFIISSFQGSFPAVSSRLNAPRTRYWRALASVYPLSFVFDRFFRGQAWDQVSAGGDQRGSRNFHKLERMFVRPRTAQADSTRDLPASTLTRRPMASRLKTKPRGSLPINVAAREDALRAERWTSRRSASCSRSATIRDYCSVVRKVTLVVLVEFILVLGCPKNFFRFMSK